MFTKVLVANRGEIACRIIRTLRELGVASVAIHSEADTLALHVRLADEAVCVGPAESAKSYLNADVIIAAAKETGAQAIHPGYGFLSENADFAIACREAGIVFIGPSETAIRTMGNKTDARATMIEAGVPVVPGTTEAVQSGSELLSKAREIGFPVLLKAASGGGGKGMRQVAEESELERSLEAAQREAQSAFGDPNVYIEKVILSPRHIEIQILADELGNTVHLFERECSVQRRHQKVIEESPACNLSNTTRNAMGDIAVKAAQSIGYVGAGTFEFLVDSEENFYFLEMNTRLQVEHPVTELVTGVDLCALQIRIAAGEALPFKQEDLEQSGYAIECRIYAEDPSLNFSPSPGKLRRYRPPVGAGIRVDDGVREGDEISLYYDPMIAKLCAWADNRPAAIARLDRALGEYAIAGIAHNVEFLRWVMKSDAFSEGRYSTDLLQDLGAYQAPVPPEEDRDLMLLAGVLTHIQSALKPAAEGTSSTEPSRWRQAFLPGDSSQ